MKTDFKETSLVVVDRVRIRTKNNIDSRLSTDCWFDVRIVIGDPAWRQICGQVTEGIKDCIWDELRKKRSRL